MTQGKAWGVVTAIVALGALLVVPAQAGVSSSRQTASVIFTQTEPRASSGMKQRVDYVNPDDPSAKPPAVRRIATRLQVGSRIDTEVPAKCDASDAQLTAQGATVCPEESRVGMGLLTVDTGIPGPGRFATSDVVLLNNTDELIFVTTPRGTDARVVTHSPVIGDHVIVTKIPPLPGAPPDAGAVDTANLRLRSVQREIDGKRRAYIRTPQHCPQDGGWTNRTRFTYADGVTQVVTNRSPCST